MSYPALPDHRIPYHRDGTRVGYRSSFSGGSVALLFGQGIATWLNQSQLIELNDPDFTSLGQGVIECGDIGYRAGLWVFFPESREVTALAVGSDVADAQLSWGGNYLLERLEGSSDSTNGVDGTWEVASFPSGTPGTLPGLDGWRSTIKPVSFTGPKRALRMAFLQSIGGAAPDLRVAVLHLYGEKAAGQTPDDIVFVDDVTDLEFQSVLDFGDRPLGTTVTRVFRLKNTSTTRTANALNLQCNDSDFAISADGTTWVATLNFASLAPGAETANLYVRCTTPNPGATLGPRFAEMVVTVGSWT